MFCRRCGRLFHRADNSFVSGGSTRARKAPRIVAPTTANVAGGVPRPNRWFSIQSTTGLRATAKSAARRRTPNPTHNKTNTHAARTARRILRRVAQATRISVTAKSGLLLPVEGLQEVGHVVRVLFLLSLHGTHDSRVTRCPTRSPTPKAATATRAVLSSA